MTTGLSELVQAMLEPDFYPHKPVAVEMVQTQMSFIFLTGDYVYKVKKPVNFGYLDYTNLEQRRYFCEQEIVLNRRLCPETYLGFIPIYLYQGRYSLEGPGETVEYAVKMKQLPRNRTMDVLLHQDRVTTTLLDRVAQKVADFHRDAKSDAVISSFGDMELVIKNVEENFAQTEGYIGRTVSREQWERARGFSYAFLERNKALFSQRKDSGRIRDCHGDLHSAHICFSDGICIFDCIEFNDRFRYTDVASEIAFLAMDLDYYGRGGLSDYFVNSYVAVSGDSQLLELLDFYKCYRAYVRGKVNSFKTDDTLVPEKERQDSALAARRYFELANVYTAKTTGSALIATMGLVGTGKTMLAEALSKKTGVQVISSDVIRKRLAGVPLTERHFDGYDSGLYASDMTRKTYDEIFTRAGKSLQQGKSVILDASFRKTGERRTAQSIAGQHKAGFLLIECCCAEEEIRKRLEKRVVEGSVSDGRWEIYEVQKRDTEPVVELPPLQYLRLDTTRPITELVNVVVNRWGWWEEKTA